MPAQPKLKPSCTADPTGAPPRRINFCNALPDERVKFFVGHTAELIYMCALDLLHVLPHEFAALHFRGDGRAQFTRRPCRVAKALQLAHVAPLLRPPSDWPDVIRSKRALEICSDASLVQPDIRQILVQVIARADLPAFHIGAQGNDPMPIGHNHLMCFVVENELL